MSPPTSPTNPSRPALPGGPSSLRDSPGSGLRHLVSGSFLNRMNEISADILSRYSDGVGSDSGFQRVQVPPARPLAAPLRAMPDLDLNMNIDFSSSPHRSSDIRLHSYGDLFGQTFSSDDDIAMSDGSDHSESDSTAEENYEDDGDEGDSESDIIDADDSDEDANAYISNDGLGSDDDLDDYGTDVLQRRRHLRDSDSASFLNSVHVAQILLLSSARQNTTNENTLINTRPSSRRSSSSTSSESVPLMRQNAMRVRPDQMTGRRLDVLAKALHREYKEVVTAIKDSGQAMGKSLLFSNHPRCSSTIQLKKWPYSRKQRRYSMQQKMDTFLHSRRSGRLWPQKECGCTNTVEKSPSRKKSKRRAPLEKVVDAKRRKVKPSRSGQALQIDAPLNYGSAIDKTLLSRLDNFNILGGLPCSFLESGSIFSLETRECIPKHEHDTTELVVSHVDHDEKILYGHFALRSHNPIDNLGFLKKFLTFLCGGTRSCYAVNQANKIIQAKSALLNELVMTSDLSNSVQMKPKAFSQALHLPFCGELIDFNKHDLRFLESSKPSNNDSCLSRVQNERLKIQLGEWLRIKPFQNFTETFFMNHVLFAETNLKNFGDLSNQEKIASFEFAKNMQSSIVEITQDFDPSVLDDVPMVQERLSRVRKDLSHRYRHEPRSNLRKSTFSQEWDTKICEKLCDYITCTDSCLLSLQLNYILFTVRVDVSATLDLLFDRVLNSESATMERKSITSKYNLLRRQKLASEAKDTVFVCSVNRKTGKLEMQNTRSQLDYKYAGSRGFDNLLASLGHAESSRGPVEDTIADVLGANYVCSDGHRSSSLEDPSLMGNPTVVVGSCKRGTSGTFSSGKDSQFDIL